MRTILVFFSVIIFLTNFASAENIGIQSKGEVFDLTEKTKSGSHYLEDSKLSGGYILANATESQVTYYICPSCPYNGNGLAHGCAENNGLSGAYNSWSDVNVSGPNMFLQCSGKENMANATYIDIMDGGISPVHRLIIGSYNFSSGNLTTDKAYINGLGNGRDRVIQSVADYFITIQDIDIVYDDDSTQANRIGIAIPSSGGDPAIDYDNIIQRVRVHDIRNNDSNGIYWTNGIRANANGGLRIIDSIIENIDTDCFWGGGNNLEIGNSIIRFAGEDSANSGDELQIPAITGNVGIWIHDNVFEHSDRDEKQVLMITANSSVIENNHIFGYTGQNVVNHRVLNIGKSNNFTIRNNYIEGSSQDGVIFTAGGSGLNGSNKIYNNVIKVTRNASTGIYLYNDHNEIYNNVIVYNNTINSTASGIYQNNKIKGGIFKNNIITGFHYGIRSAELFSNYSNNLLYNNDIDCVHANQIIRSCGNGSIFSDPLFVDANNKNYRLQKSSPAIDAGIEVGIYSDFDGNGVPFDGDGNGIADPDIGAFEFIILHRADFNEDGCVNDSELLGFIKLWKIDSTEFGISELMEALGMWESAQGCS